MRPLFSSLIFSSVLILSLTACKPFWDPTYYPSGYTHHDKAYKSPPGPAVTDIGYEYSREQNAAVNEAFLNAARDLTARAKAEGFASTRPYYLVSDLQDSAFKGALDNALRQAMRENGTMTTMDSSLGTPLFYSAYNPAMDRAPEYDSRINTDDANHPDMDGTAIPQSGTMELVLIQQHDKYIDKQVSTMMDIPLHDFKPTGYLPPHTRPLPKKAMTEDSE